jgi:hypothetical protein
VMVDVALLNSTYVDKLKTILAESAKPLAWLCFNINIHKILRSDS